MRLKVKVNLVSGLYSVYKRYFTIDQQKVRYFVHSNKCLSNPLPFYATQ